jgi:hypothetical protein
MPHSGLRNKAIGQAGEFAVCAQLGKLGLIATPFSGNVPAFDVIVTDKRLACLPIQVKATLGGNFWHGGDIRDYCECALDPHTGRQSLGEPRHPKNPDLVMIYVRLSKKPGEQDRFFILTQTEAWSAIVQNYGRWLEKHDCRRPKRVDSYHCGLELQDIESYENIWGLIGTRLSGMSPGG